MYLADIFSRLTHAAAEREARDAIDCMPNSEALRFYLGCSKALLDDYELFSFERSALIAASDMRLERQRGLEAVAEIVLQKPRKLFLEADYSDRVRAFSQLRMLPPRSDPSIGDPGRVGIALDIHGGGRATVQLAWTTPRNEGRIFSNDLFRALGVPKQQMRFLQRLCLLNWSAFTVELDLSQKSDLDYDEFSARLDAGDEECARFLSAAEAMKIYEVPSAIRRHAWNVMRLNSFCRMRLDPRAKAFLPEFMMQAGVRSEAEAEQLLDTLRSDLDGEVVFALAMSAVLEIKDIDLAVRRERPAPPLQKRVAKAKGRSRSGGTEATGPQPRLGVVSLHLDQEVVRGVFSNDRGASKPVRNNGSSTSSSPRTRHPVRGHLFLARNKKIVYRRPHFRGTIQGKHITRVL